MMCEQGRLNEGEGHARGGPVTPGAPPTLELREFVDAGPTSSEHDRLRETWRIRSATPSPDVHEQLVGSSL